MARFAVDFSQPQRLAADQALMPTSKRRITALFLVLASSSACSAFGASDEPTASAPPPGQNADGSPS